MNTRVNRAWIKVGAVRIAVDMIAAFESTYEGQANTPRTQVHFAGGSVVVDITPTEFEALILSTNP